MSNGPVYSLSILLDTNERITKWPHCIKLGTIDSKIKLLLQFVYVSNDS